MSCTGTPSPSPRAGVMAAARSGAWIAVCCDKIVFAERGPSHNLADPTVFAVLLVTELRYTIVFALIVL